jgi:sugar-specific transcriptional regulator TrmB
MADECKCGCCAPPASDADTRAALEREKREAQRRVEELERRIDELEGTPA